MTRLARSPWLPWATGLVALALVVFAILRVQAWQGREDEAAVVARGERIYMESCAACHGERLQGQPNWQYVGADGRVPAPPHDATGHTWQHSDAELFAITKFGREPPAMPGFAETLSDDEIRATILFIKSRWPASLRAAQAMLNPDLAGMPSGDIDWTFPPDCGFEPIRPSP